MSGAFRCSMWEANLLVSQNPPIVSEELLFGDGGCLS